MKAFSASPDTGQQSGAPIVVVPYSSYAVGEDGESVWSLLSLGPTLHESTWLICYACSTVKCAQMASSSKSVDARSALGENEQGTVEPLHVQVPFITSRSLPTHF